MCNKLGSRLVKILTVILAVMMLIPAVAASVNAAGGTVKDVGTAVAKTDMIELELDTSKIVTELPSSTADADQTVLNKTYTAVYPSALDYFGTKLTVEVTAKQTSNGQMADYEGASSKLWVDEGYVRSTWERAVDVHTEWTIKITDPATGEAYPVRFLVGFNDPDESNYIFDTTSKELFYYDPDDATTANRASTHYAVKNDGIYRLDDEGNELDPATYRATPSDLHNDSFFFVGLKKEDAGYLAFRTDTFSWGGIKVPYIYAKQYKVNYVLNDDETAPATNPSTNPGEYHSTGETIEIEDPTRPGYKFVGWEDENGNPKDTIDPWEEGDKTFVAKWEKIEYKIEYKPNEEYAGGEGSVSGEMDDQTVTLGDNTLNDNEFSAVGYKFVGWNTKPDGSGDAYNDPDTYVVTVEAIEGKKDGDIVGTLYAQWEPIEYLIKYDPNGGEGEMDDDDHRKYDTDYELSTHLYTREGYTWVGWNTEADRSGTEYTENEGYRNLTAEDGGVITMYAQWEPWKYYIDYDANGGQGEMPMQTFNYEDESMMSNKNQFTRDGYKFVGFIYTYNGNTKLITDPAEFREMLLSLGPESKITLIAQWEKIAVKAAPIPVTGVE